MLDVDGDAVMAIVTAIPAPPTLSSVHKRTGGPNARPPVFRPPSCHRGETILPPGAPRPSPAIRVRLPRIAAMTSIGRSCAGKSSLPSPTAAIAPGAASSAAPPPSIISSRSVRHRNGGSIPPTCNRFAGPVTSASNSGWRFWSSRTFGWFGLGFSRLTWHPKPAAPRHAPALVRPRRATAPSQRGSGTSLPKDPPPSPGAYPRFLPAASEAGRRLFLRTCGRGSGVEANNATLTPKKSRWRTLTRSL